MTVIVWAMIIGKISNTLATGQIISIPQIVNNKQLDRLTIMNKPIVKSSATSTAEICFVLVRPYGKASWMFNILMNNRLIKRIVFICFFQFESIYWDFGALLGVRQKSDARCKLFGSTVKSSHIDKSFVVALIIILNMKIRSINDSENLSKRWNTRLKKYVCSYLIT